MIYGHVLEICHPDFRKAEINSVDVAQINPSMEMMERHAITKEVIWDHLDRTSEINQWADRQADYEAAQGKNDLMKVVWRERIEKYFSTRVHR